MLFEFHDKIMIDNFLIKLTRFTKTELIGTFFNPLGNLKILNPLSEEKIDHCSCATFDLVIEESNQPKF